MRILLDENFPLELVRDFPGHECSHVVTIGWSGVVNGELLARAEKAEFDVLLTFYSGIPRDHDIAARQIAVYVIQPEGQGPAATCAMIERIKIELRSLHPGQVLTLSNRTGKRPLA